MTTVHQADGLASLLLLLGLRCVRTEWRDSLNGHLHSVAGGRLRPWDATDDIEAGAADVSALRWAIFEDFLTLPVGSDAEGRTSQSIAGQLFSELLDESGPQSTMNAWLRSFEQSSLSIYRVLQVETDGASILQDRLIPHATAAKRVYAPIELTSGQCILARLVLVPDGAGPARAPIVLTPGVLLTNGSAAEEIGLVLAELQSGIRSATQSILEAVSPTGVVAPKFLDDVSTRGLQDAGIVALRLWLRHHQDAGSS